MPSLGGPAGTHYIVAALHLAYPARAPPHAPSATQPSLILAPLKAAEMINEATDNVSAEVKALPDTAFPTPKPTPGGLFVTPGAVRRPEGT
ncbi:hypothetical protein [Arthrobacter sp. OAP107]|uniref:hypothetical protein n=1 Tax=Arthrobacter sp. OAP107 TaxID=3156445 RepID=UPI0033938334